MPTFRIALAYDGTDFVGWQRQAAGTSVQGLIEDAARELDGRDVTVVGAGRTDAGVHALGQAASLTLERAVDAATLVRALNARLPDEVRVLTAEGVPPTFHARFSARSKTYRYRVWNGDICSPFERRFACHAPGALDVEAMTEAARLVEGRHDFAAFQAAGGATRTTERVVMRSTLAVETRAEPCPGRLFVYEIEGNGFLRHMVRTIVGSLIEIGRGRRPVAWMGELIVSRDRARAGPTAPPEGLFLVRVDYDEPGALAAEP